MYLLSRMHCGLAMCPFHESLDLVYFGAARSLRSRECDIEIHQLAKLWSKVYIIGVKSCYEHISPCVFP